MPHIWSLSDQCSMVVGKKTLSGASRSRLNSGVRSATTPASLRSNHSPQPLCTTCGGELPVWSTCHLALTSAHAAPAGTTSTLTPGTRRSNSSKVLRSPSWRSALATVRKVRVAGAALRAVGSPPASPQAAASTPQTAAPAPDVTRARRVVCWSRFIIGRLPPNGPPS